MLPRSLARLPAAAACRHLPRVLLLLRVLLPQHNAAALVAQPAAHSDLCPLFQVRAPSLSRATQSSRHFDWRPSFLPSALPSSPPPLELDRKSDCATRELTECITNRRRDRRTVSQILIGAASVFCLAKGRNSTLDLEGQRQIKNDHHLPSCLPSFGGA